LIIAVKYKFSTIKYIPAYKLFNHVYSYMIMEKKEILRQSYIQHILENGRKPASIYAFARQQNITETEFYEHYNSFEALEKDVWSGFLENTLTKLYAEEVYASYSVREKLLSFYYTWIEELKANRSYILVTYRPGNLPLATPPELTKFRREFIIFMNELIREGQETGEIMQRVVLSDKYADGLWLQLLFVLDFWVKDDSLGFEKTDAAIEKAVNLSFDIMGRNTLDSGLDFFKFLFQNRRSEV
jgi:AcrR family transcriptional regulator